MHMLQAVHAYGTLYGYVLCKVNLQFITFLNDFRFKKVVKALTINFAWPILCLLHSNFFINANVRAVVRS